MAGVDEDEEVADDADEEESEEGDDDDADADENMYADGGAVMLEVAPLSSKLIISNIFMTSAGTNARSSALNSWTRRCTALIRPACEALV